jgi:hypothetical protein
MSWLFSLHKDNSSIKLFKMISNKAKNNKNEIIQIYTEFDSLNKQVQKFV